MPFFDSVLSSKKGCSISVYKKGKQVEFGYESSFSFFCSILAFKFSFSVESKKPFRLVTLIKYHIKSALSVLAQYSLIFL